MPKSDFITNRARLIELGWVDSFGNSLDWKYWNKQPRKSYFVLEEIDEKEWREIQAEKEKKRKEREMFSDRNKSRLESSLVTGS